MQLTDTLRSIFRRWYILLLGLVISAGLAGAAVVLIQPTYEAEGSLLLMPPSEVVGAEGNPYLYLGGMTEALDVLARRANAPEAVEAVEKQFSGVKIASSPDRTTSSPIIAISVTGPDQEDVLSALEAGRMTVIRNLDAMQNELEVPEAMRISTENLVIDHKATANQKMAIQFAILVAAAGAVGTLMFTGFIDGQLLARARAKDEEQIQASKRLKNKPSEPDDDLDSHGADSFLSELPPFETTFEPSRSMIQSLKQ